MNSVDIKWSTYIESSKEINDKDTKFKIGDIVRIWQFKIIFTKGYVSNCSEEVFEIKKSKKSVPLIYVISNLKSKEIVETFDEKELKKKTNRKEFKVEQVIKGKGN